MMPKMVSDAGVARDGYHVKAHRAHAGHGLELFKRKRTRFGCANHAGVLGHGNERAGKTAHARRRHDAALLHGVVEHGECGRGARASALCLRRWSPRCRPPNRRRREWEQARGRGCPSGTPRRFDASRAISSPARVILNTVALMVSATVVKSASSGSSASTACTTPGPRNAHVDNLVGLARTMEGAGHEGVVFYGVAEHHELACADAVPVGSRLRRPCWMMPAILQHGVHVHDPRVSSQGSRSSIRARSAASACGNGIHELVVGCAMRPSAPSAEKPPTKSTPTSAPALSMASADGRQGRYSLPPRTLRRWASRRCACSQWECRTRAPAARRWAPAARRPMSCDRRPWLRRYARRLAAQPRRFKPQRDSSNVEVSACSPWLAFRRFLPA